MDTNNTNNADFITIVSSEMIANVMEYYFNDVMYKKKVSIVDLKPTDSGYMFSLAFVQPAESIPHDNKQLIKASVAKSVDNFIKKIEDYPVITVKKPSRRQNGQSINKQTVKVEQ